MAIGVVMAGATGWVGKALVPAILMQEDMRLVGAVARSTAGHDVGVVAAGNYSITATLMKKFAQMAAQYGPDVEIIDYASARKPDAPSGTALELAETLSEIRGAPTALPTSEVFGHPEARGATMGEGTAVQVHSLRLPSYQLSCEAVFGLPEERLTIRHDAGTSAVPYVAGALLAIRRVREFSGLVRVLDALMDETLSV